MSNKVAVAAETEQKAKYYGGTITVAGRNLITSLLVGETLEFTRIVVGSGLIPDGIEPIDMTDLVTPVALATSTVPIVENSVMSMTVEFRNDMNGGLTQGFWIREFGIFAKTKDTEEILLYYATLGDSPQPINAYQDNRVDIRRYPVTIALELDADIQVTYVPESFVTASEAQELVAALVKEEVSKVDVAVTVDVTIPANGWKEQTVEETTDSDDDDWPLYIDVPCNAANAMQVPEMSLDKLSLKTAKNAGLCPTIQALDGVLRFWATENPQKDMTGTVVLLHTIFGEEQNGTDYRLPAATSTTLGGVIVEEGSGLMIDAEGRISVDVATEDEVTDAIEDAFGEGSYPGDIPPGDDSTDTGNMDVASDDEVSDMLTDIFG